MDENLKRLTEELGVAINESLGESERIAEAVAEIRRNGYEVFLVLNATVLIRNKGERKPGSLARHAGNLQSRLSSEDMDFLESMHISVTR